MYMGNFTVSTSLKLEDTFELKTVFLRKLWQHYCIATFLKWCWQSLRSNGKHFIWKIFPFLVCGSASRCLLECSTEILTLGAEPVPIRLLMDGGWGQSWGGSRLSGKDLLLCVSVGFSLLCWWSHLLALSNPHRNNTWTHHITAGDSLWKELLNVYMLITERNDSCGKKQNTWVWAADKTYRNFISFFAFFVFIKCVYYAQVYLFWIQIVSKLCPWDTKMVQCSARFSFFFFSFLRTSTR